MRNTTLGLALAGALAAGLFSCGGEPEPRGPHPALRDPDLAAEQAPDQYRVQLETTQGPIVIEVTRAWAPHAADRFYNLVKIGFFEDIAFFRVISGFMAQLGIHGDPEISRLWHEATIPDDKVVQSNRRGFVSFARTRMPNSRTTQFFINFGDNQSLDRQGFPPFGKVVSGMEVLDAIYVTGEGAPRGSGPAQQLIQRQGNAYLKERFPEIDYLTSARLLE